MDMGLDSVEIVVWAENEFAVEIADSVCSEILTLNQFVDCIQAICSAITSYTQTIKKPPEGGFFNRRL